MSDLIIEEAVLEGRKLSSRLHAPKSFEKFFKEKELFIEYDAEINVDESILNIPLTATILPLAWLTGTNVIVGKLDKTFKKGMDALQKEFAKSFPLIPFSTEIKAEELVENKIVASDPSNNLGILFSGGVDSTYTLIENLHSNPKLIMIWGIDDFPYPERADHWEKTIEIYRDYSEKKKLELFMLKTNISQILDDRRISHRYHKELYDGSVGGALQHSLTRLPSAAPLSIGRFDKLLIAASGNPASDPLRPLAARPWFDDKIIWGDLTVENHGFIARKDKIYRLANYMKDDDITLRVCLKSRLVDGLLNDCSCSKCLGTIALLVVSGADPNKCGFKVDESTFGHMKDFLISAKRSRIGKSWYLMQEIARNGVDFEVPGSKEFFMWLRDFDLGSAKKKWLYTDLYMSLPYWLARNLDRVYYRMGINIHEGPYKRAQNKKVK